MEICTVAAQHTRTSYRRPSSRPCRRSHEGYPSSFFSMSLLGNSARRCVRMLEWCAGTRAGRWRSMRVGWVSGMSIAGGPRKMVFSVFEMANGRFPRRYSEKKMNLIMAALSLHDTHTSDEAEGCHDDGSGFGPWAQLSARTRCFSFVYARATRRAQQHKFHNIASNKRSILLYLAPVPVLLPVFISSPLLSRPVLNPRPFLHPHLTSPFPQPKDLQLGFAVVRHYQ